MNPRAPYLLLTALVMLAFGGVAFLVCGAILNYGPLYTAGGIFIGFAYGFYLARQAALRTIKELKLNHRRQ